MLYPKQTVIREVVDLNGIWNFEYNNKKIKMPVPASFNDITSCYELKNFIGTVKYQREFFVNARQLS